MPKENFPTSDAIEAVVEKAGVDFTDDHRDELERNQFNPYAAQMRDPNNKDHVKEDLKDLKKGVLDEGSFVQAYLPHEHPVEYLVHDSEGKLKQRIYSHNIRTDVGGELQGLQLMADNPSNYGYVGTSTTAAPVQAVAPPAGTGAYAGITTSPTAAQTAQTSGSITLATALGSATASGTSPTLSGQYAGKICWITGGNAPASGAWGVILGNTTTVIYVDYWRAPGATPLENAATIGTAAAATSVYVLPFVNPFMYMGLSNDSTAVSAQHTAAQGFNALTADPTNPTPTTVGEYVTNGLVRKPTVQAAAGSDGTNPSPYWFSPFNTGGSTNAINQLPGYNTAGGPYPAGTATNNGAFKSVVKFSPTGGTGTAAFINKSALFNTAFNYTNATTTNSTAAGTAALNGAGIPVFVANLTTAATLAFGDTLTVTWQIQF